MNAPLEAQAAQHRDSLGEHVAIRQLTAGTQFVDDLWQHTRHGAGSVAKGEAQLLGDVLNLPAAEDGQHLFTGNGQVFPVADPGGDDVAQSLFLEGSDQTLQAPVLSIAEQSGHGFDQAGRVTGTLARQRGSRLIDD
ncbi:MAG TPA: hypothetical protein VMV35_10030 [Halothiobacillus sp.]|nr:hypothetical protein [Halothiobacillus sp.]